MTESRQRRRHLADDSGETAIGTAVLFAAVLAALFMVIQLLLGYYVRAVASAAAIDAAVLAAQDGASPEAGEKAARTLILAQAGGLVVPEDLEIDVDIVGDERTVVTVSGKTRMAWFVKLDVSASAPVERFRPQGG